MTIEATNLVLPYEDGADKRIWALRQLFMLRVAGLPVETVHGLRCPNSRRWAAEVLREERLLTAAGVQLSDELHLLVSGQDDEAVRRLLLRLRREVFNGRSPADP